MRRLALSLILIALAFLVLRRVYVALASDETQIRWLVDRMESAYDAGRAGACVADVHRDWTHEGRSPTSVNRANLEAGLRGRFFQSRAPEGRELLLAVDVDRDTLEIAVAEDGTATLRCEARFLEKEREVWGETWRVRLEADLVHDEGRWQILRTRHTTLEGRGY